MLKNLEEWLITRGSNMNYDIVVLGSINLDIITKVDKYPDSGDTIIAKGMEMFPGGKGANQAIAVTKQGDSMIFLGAVGKDDFGKQILTNLDRFGVNTESVLKLENSQTGTCTIVLDAHGENTMMGSLGANLDITKEHMQSAFADIEAKIFLLQMETTKESIIESVKIANEKGMYIILDPAPAEGYFEEILPEIDLIIPNQQETERITGIKVSNLDDAKSAAKKIHQAGVKEVIIKMGGDGCFYYSNEESFFIEALPVKALNTVGAGDTFAGALASGILKFDTKKEAIEYANKAAGIKVSRAGGQEEIPTSDELTD